MLYFRTRSYQKTNSASSTDSVWVAEQQESIARAFSLHAVETGFLVAGRLTNHISLMLLIRLSREGNPPWLFFMCHAWMRNLGLSILNVVGNVLVNDGFWLVVEEEFE